MFSVNQMITELRNVVHVLDPSIRIAQFHR